MSRRRDEPCVRCRRCPRCAGPWRRAIPRRRRGSWTMPCAAVPFRDHRWTRHRAWLRVRPTVAAASYEITLWMGSPAPSPYEAPVVRVTTPDGQERGFTLSRVVAPFRLRAAPDKEGVVSVRLDAPTWNRRGEPAEQGISAERMTVTAVR